MSFFRKLFRLEETPKQPGPTDDFWYEPLRGSDEAMQVAAVGACVRFISETIASLPKHIYLRLDDNSRELARQHPAYAMLHSMANEMQTSFEFFECMVRDILCHGACLARLVLDARDNVVAMVPLEWKRVQIKKDPQTGVRVFVYTEDGGEKTSYVDSEVLFIPGPGCTPFKVVSLLEQNSETIGLSIAAQRYVKNYFQRGALGPIFATFPAPLGAVKLKEWADWFMKNFGGSRNAHKVPVFDNGAKLDALRVDHSQMQLNELRQGLIAEIARIFGVPPHLIQDLTRSTNNNIEHQGIEVVVHMIRHWTTRIESRMNASLFGPIEGARYFVEFDLDGLLRGDSAAQAVLLAAEIQNAGMTPNEWRRLKNRKPMEGGNQLFIQGATVPITMAGVQQQPAGATK